MLLSDHELIDAITGGWLGWEPFDPDLVQPASIDVRLDRYFRTFPGGGGDVDPAAEPGGFQPPALAVADDQWFTLGAGQFALASTVERMRMPANLAARVEGKSSLGRLGLMVHSTAGWIDPGFDGHITLELTNVRQDPIRLYPGMRIGQVAVMRMSKPARAPYGSRNLGSHYQQQGRGPRLSQGWRGWRLWPLDPESGRNAPPAGLRQRHGDQPLPVGNDGPHIHDLVAADLAGRKQLGVQRYGQPLQPGNGRNALRDAYEEALDLSVYLKQAIVESEGQS